MPRAGTWLSAPKVVAKTYDVPVETFSDGSLREQFQPDLVSPAAVYLAHESCTAQGVVLISGGDQVMRLAIVTNEGITTPNITFEDIAENFETTLLDLSTAVEATVGSHRDSA